MGLDNAGKTSIITAITKKFGFEDEVFNLMPTRRVVRDAFRFLGIEFIRMDFGGQKQYREEYIKYPQKYLSGMHFGTTYGGAQDLLQISHSVHPIQNYGCERIWKMRSLQDMINLLSQVCQFQEQLISNQVS